MKSLIFAFCVVFGFGDLGAQTNKWQPSVGHVQIPIWPGAAPDAEAVPGPENYTTTTKLIAGRPAVLVNNVSQPTMTVYSPKEKNTGAAVVVFPGGGYLCLGIDLEGTEICDWLTSQQQVDLIGRAVDSVKFHGLSCGVGAHRLEVIVECEKAGIDNDFYLKTFHSHNYPSSKLEHDSMWCYQPDEVIGVMREVKKPWIAFKVMAAGAIPPQVAFRYAFENGADFVLAGMFDFEIAEDVRIAKEVLAGVKRNRPWLA